MIVNPRQPPRVETHGACPQRGTTPVPRYCLEPRGRHTGPARPTNWLLPEGTAVHAGPMPLSPCPHRPWWPSHPVDLRVRPDGGQRGTPYPRRGRRSARPRQRARPPDGGARLIKLRNTPHCDADGGRHFRGLTGGLCDLHRSLERPSRMSGLVSHPRAVDRAPRGRRQKALWRVRWCDSVAPR